MVDAEKILDIENTLSGINWFIYTGNASISIKPDNFSCLQAKNLREVSRCIKSPVWEDQISEAQNKLSSFLRTYHKEEFKNWNEVADEALDSFRKVKDKLRKQCSLHRFKEEYLSSIKNSYIRIYIELYYKNIEGVPGFFIYLLEIYKAGKLPCGWLSVKQEKGDCNQDGLSGGRIIIW